MCAKHLRKVLHQNVVVQKELAPRLWPTPFLFATTHSLTFASTCMDTEFGSHSHSLPLQTVTPWPPLVWSTACPEGQTCVLA